MPDLWAHALANPYVQAIVLGVVEGATEFIPVSSTGHLIIVGNLIGYTNDQSKVFKIVIQLAAILAVCWDYREKLLGVAAGLTREPAARRFAGNVLVGFLPAMVLGVLLHSTIKSYLFNPLTVAAALIVGGLAILYIERKVYQPRFESVDQIGWREALKVGFAQTLALFPGVSRAGATIMGGLVFGLSRKAAAELSFFLAIPTMLAATVYDLYKNWEILSFDDAPVFAVGFVASFVSAMVVVKALVRYVSTHSFVPFAWYRIAFGLVVLVTAATGAVDWGTR
ncbi:MAG: undecaprenyl-diphosphate phosphatase [Gammaproteobacteria bacterium]|jgi:undecaprenyl-diphosphatase|nr:undecaprenyl-diphosphate phosphatase [Gammaproteobacteria bacterium]